MPNPLKGSCLCGAHAFELEIPTLRIYRCHCSLCRKATGTASNCAAIIDAAHFRWVTHSDRITDWTKPTGYRSTFCAVCGSQLPRPLVSRSAFWVPAGLLDDGIPAEIVADFFVSSKAQWDNMPLARAQHEEFPTVDEFFSLMHPQ